MALGEMLRGIRPIAIRVRSDKVETEVSHATSIGLIVNELVTNDMPIRRTAAAPSR